MVTHDVATIRARMARIRSRAQGKAVRLSRETRQFLDWKHYVRLFPWGVLGAAAIAGYLLVPARKSAPVDTSNVAGTSASPTPSATDTQGPGLFSSLTRTVVNVAMRTAVAYAGRALGDYIAQIIHSPPTSLSSEGSEPDDIRHEPASRGYRSEFSQTVG